MSVLGVGGSVSRCVHNAVTFSLLTARPEGGLHGTAPGTPFVDARKALTRF